MEELPVRLFDWFEYIVFSVMISFSVLIGIFFWFYKGGQHTKKEYFLGNQTMSVYPIAMSLIASSISGVTLLGQPTEIYFYGAQFALVNIANFLIYLINVTVCLPVFYNLQVLCLYEYLEMRFNRRVRILASILYTFSCLFFIPVVMYGPALAFNQVSGISVHIVAPVLCIICIFYTTVGGLKAVVWADALQGSVMIFSLIVVLITGLVRVGGFGAVFSAAYQSGRLNVFNFDPDPTVRISFWSSTVGLTFLWLSYTAVDPTSVQRFIALPTLRDAKRSSLYQCIGICTFSLFSIFLGLIIYANYQNCDPLSSKEISRPDQILPYFVLDVVGHIKGIPGLFVAGNVCAALSTMSTGLNTLAGTVYEDFVEPLIGKKSERSASNLMKCISVGIGALCIVLVLLVEKMGNIIDLCSKFGGVTCGAILGIFAMGLLIPQTNSHGAFYGGITASVFMLWTMVGRELSFSSDCVPKKPLSVASCLRSNVTIAEGVCPEVSEAVKLAFPLHGLTVFYYGLLGLTVSLLVGLIVTYLTGPNLPSSINKDLLSPVIRHLIPSDKTDYGSVTLKERKENGPATCNV